MLCYRVVSLSCQIHQNNNSCQNHQTNNTQVLYAMLSGREPFKARPRQELGITHTVSCSPFTSFNPPFTSFDPPFTSFDPPFTSQLLLFLHFFSLLFYLNYCVCFPCSFYFIVPFTPCFFSLHLPFILSFLFISVSPFPPFSSLPGKTAIFVTNIPLLSLHQPTKSVILATRFPPNIGDRSRHRPRAWLASTNYSNFF